MTATADHWLAVRSRHFTVYSNADSRIAQDVAIRLERLCEVLQLTNPGLGATSPPPTAVYAFRDERSFKSYRPRDVEDVTGWFKPGEDRNVIAFNLAPEAGDGIETLCHEFVHCYLDTNVPDPPLWLNEGLAEYYSTFAPGDMTAEIGRTKPTRIAWCQTHALLPIADLLAFTHDTPDYARATDRRHTFYAESWLLVHHLLQAGDEDTRRFEGFVRELRRGGDARRAFEGAFPPDRWGALVAQLDRDTRVTTTFWRYTFGEKLHADSTQVAFLRPAETLYQLGDLVLHVDEVGDLAARHFRAALAADSTHAAAIAALGFLADLADDPRTAETRYARARALAGRDPRPSAIAGRGALHRHFGHPGLAPVDSVPPALREASDDFARCLALDPGNLQALAGFGRSHDYDRDPPAEAIHALETAAVALPARTDIQKDLLMLYANAGAHGAAAALLRDGLEERLDPGERRWARSVLAIGDLRTGDRLVRRGDPDRADSLFRRVAHDAEDPNLREAAEQRLAARDVEAHNGAVALYNQGVLLGNKGDYKGAIEWYRRARDASPDSALRRDADHEIARLEGVLMLNEGVMLFNDERYAEARKKLKSAIARGLDGEARAYAMRLLREIDEGKGSPR